jgi:hypothetical protein
MRHLPESQNPGSFRLKFARSSRKLAGMAEPADPLAARLIDEEGGQMDKAS